MKTAKNKLVFGKNSIIELNDQQSFTVNGGTGTTNTDDGPTTIVCSNCIPDPISNAITKTIIKGGNE